MIRRGALQYAPTNSYRNNVILYHYHYYTQTRQVIKTCRVLWLNFQAFSLNNFPKSILFEG
jgi:hypothetical protein